MAVVSSLQCIAFTSPPSPVTPRDRARPLFPLPFPFPLSHSSSTNRIRRAFHEEIHETSFAVEQRFGSSRDSLGGRRETRGGKIQRREVDTGKSHARASRECIDRVRYTPCVFALTTDERSLSLFETASSFRSFRLVGKFLYIFHRWLLFRGLQSCWRINRARSYPKSSHEFTRFRATARNRLYLMKYYLRHVSQFTNFQHSARQRSLIP